MNLTPGARLGPYEIRDPLGEGGMGAVYRARDTRLDRTVAIKILRRDTERTTRERLLREARAISALTHPHICTLYDVGVHEEVDFLVMEYVEGETLAARLARGSLPLDQVFTYAVQVASALDAAHRAGIVHRDVKPANVMLTRAGAKLLDFGIARQVAPLATPNAQTLEAADTTHSGLLVGTVSYMAPEQIEGRAVDGRTDLFALGALIYEMVSGRRAFDAESSASLIAMILERDPPRLTSVQPLAPLALERVVAVCLKKRPDERWQTAGDLQRALELTSSFEAAIVREPRSDRHLWWRVPGAAALAGVFAGAVLTWGFGAATSRSPANDTAQPPPDVRFSIHPEHESEFVPTLASVLGPQLALSPDGRYLAFVATSGGRPMLWVRPLQALQSHVIPGTEDAALPFWSSDNGSVGFFSQGMIKTVGVSGGPVLNRIEASHDPRGATWAADGTILATVLSQGGIMRASPQGILSTAISANRSVGEANHRWPWLLPDGRHYIYTTRGSDKTRRGVFLAVRDEEGSTHLVESDHGAAVADGHLLFVRGRALMAQPLDLPGRRLTGTPVALLDDIAIPSTGHPAFSASRTGVLAYARTWPTQGELTWFGRAGVQIGSPPAPPGDYLSFTLSPDGRRVAISTIDPRTATPDVWVLDLARGSQERLTFDPAIDANAFWAPDSSRIVFRSNRSGQDRVYVKLVDANAPEELVDLRMRDDGVGSTIVTDYSRDAAHVLMSVFGSTTSFDIWSAGLAGQNEAVAVVRTPFNEHHAVLSPDGRWLAYVSNESGASQVYVQSFPDGGRRWQISSQGGSEPQWRGDGGELFFLSLDQTLMSVSISTRPGFTPGLPAPLFKVRVPVSGNPYRQQYAVTGDGQRFLVNTAPASSPPPAIHMILDWQALLRSAQ